MTDTESNHVGPIIFPNEFARRQLVEQDVVVTVRGDRTVGDTWWTDEYGSSKRGDVHVEQLEEIEPDQANLTMYCELSGFPSTIAWMDAIDELHGNEAEYLYRVTKRDTNE